MISDTERRIVGDLMALMPAWVDSNARLACAVRVYDAGFRKVETKCYECGAELEGPRCGLCARADNKD